MGEGEGGRTDGAEELLAARGTAVKCYLESHLAHKDGGEDVVGDGEEDSFLDDAVGEEEEETIRGKNSFIRSFMTSASRGRRNATRLPSCPGGSWASPGPR